MKNMKPLSSLLFLAATHFAFGNAKALHNAVLESERVQVVIEGNIAKVTGTFQFRRTIRYTKDASQREGVYFPVIVPKDAKGVAEDFKLTLRLNGLIATNYAVVSNAPVTVPESDAYSIVWILANFAGPVRHKFNVSVDYEQKLLEGKFYYLPILEKVTTRTVGYEIRVNADRPIRSVGTAGGGVLTKGPRELVFIPTNLGMIVVGSLPP